MSNLNWKSLTIGLLLSWSGVSYADNCDHARNTFDDIYCTNKVYASADAELNKNYKALRARLKPNQKSLLLHSQREWIKQRDQACVSEADQAVDVECRLQQTRDRNHWLQERLRECKTIGCKTSLLKD